MGGEAIVLCVHPKARSLVIKKKGGGGGGGGVLCLYLATKSFNLLARSVQLCCSNYRQLWLCLLDVHICGL